MVLQAQHEHITPGMLRNAYQGKAAVSVTEKKSQQNGSEFETLLQDYDWYIKRFELQVLKDKISDETLRQWNTNRRKIKGVF